MTSGLGTKQNVSRYSKGYDNSYSQCCIFFWLPFGEEDNLLKADEYINTRQASAEAVPSSKYHVWTSLRGCEVGEGMVCCHVELSFLFPMERNWKHGLRVSSGCQDVNVDVLVVSWLPLCEHMFSLAPLRCLEEASRVVLGRAPHLLKSIWSHFISL